MLTKVSDSSTAFSLQTPLTSGLLACLHLRLLWWCCVVQQACRALSAGKHVALKDRILFDTCTRTNRELWHQNFVRTR